MSEPPLLFDFTGVYPAEGLDRALGGVLLDCRDIEGTSCYCSPEAEAQLCALLSAHPGSRIHWLDSGDYHYLSRLTTDRLREPFSLVVFDHHPDMQAPAFGEILSCGGWVRSVLERSPLVRRVLLVGVAPELASEGDGFGGRARVYDRTALPDPQALTEALDPQLPVYLSIDKDVLRRADARTDWDQGTMTLEALEGYIEALSERFRLLGADVCGEVPAFKGGTPEDFSACINKNYI